MTFPLIPAQCPLALTGDDRNVHNCTQTPWPFHPRRAERQRSRADTHAKRVSKLQIAQSQGQSRRRLATTAATPLNLLSLSRSATAQSLARDAAHATSSACTASRTRPSWRWPRTHSELPCYKSRMTGLCRRCTAWLPASPRWSRDTTRPPADTVTTPAVWASHPLPLNMLISPRSWTDTPPRLQPPPGRRAPSSAVAAAGQHLRRSSRKSGASTTKTATHTARLI